MAKIVDAAQNDMATQLGSLEETVLTLAEALLRPNGRPEVRFAERAQERAQERTEIRPIRETEGLMPHQVRREAATIYVLATPTAAAAVIAPRPAPLATRPASRPASNAPVPRSVGPGSGAGKGFTYGYCTWWVATKRSIPWRGNAAQWWWNARAFGFAEGSAPQAGAIMVMGVSGTSPQGHVGYVESVNPNGSFVVSEMNWWGVPGGGWGRVDYRTVTSMRGILGFIY